MRQPGTNPVIQAIVTATMLAVFLGITSQALKFWREGKRRAAVAWAIGAPIVIALALAALAPIIDKVLG